MMKVKEFFRSINYRKLFKYIAISIIILYVCLSLNLLVSWCLQYNVKINNDTEKLQEYEEILQSIEDDIVYLYETDRIENPRTDTLGLLEEKYPNAMYLQTHTIFLIQELVDVVRLSVFFGIFIGIAVYLYKNSTNIFRLILGYILVTALVLIADEIMLSLPSFIQISINGSSINGGMSWIGDTFITYVGICTLLTLIKFIQNKYTSKSLNELIKK